MFRVHPCIDQIYIPQYFCSRIYPQIRMIVTLQVLSLTKIWGADIDTVRLWCSFASWNIIRPSFKYIWFDTLETLSNMCCSWWARSYTWPLTLLSSNIYFRQAFQSASLRPRHQSRGQRPAFGHGGQQRFHASKQRPWDLGHCETFGPRKGQGFGSKIWTSEIWKLTLLSRCFKWITQVDYDDFPVPLSSIWLHGSNCLRLRPWRRHQNRLDQWRYHESSWDIRLIQGFVTCCDAIRWFFPIHKRCISGFVTLHIVL